MIDSEPAPSSSMQNADDEDHPGDNDFILLECVEKWLFDIRQTTHMEELNIFTTKLLADQNVQSDIDTLHSSLSPQLDDDLTQRRRRDVNHYASASILAPRLRFNNDGGDISICSEDLEPYYEELPEKPALNTDVETMQSKRKPYFHFVKYNSTSSTEVDSARGTGSPVQSSAVSKTPSITSPGNVKSDVNHYQRHAIPNPIVRRNSDVDIVKMRNVKINGHRNERALSSLHVKTENEYENAMPPPLPPRRSFAQCNRLTIGMAPIIQTIAHIHSMLDNIMLATYDQWQFAQYVRRLIEQLHRINIAHHMPFSDLHDITLRTNRLLDCDGYLDETYLYLTRNLVDAILWYLAQFIINSLCNEEDLSYVDPFSFMQLAQICLYSPEVCRRLISDLPTVWLLLQMINEAIDSNCQFRINAALRYSLRTLSVLAALPNCRLIVSQSNGLTSICYLILKCVDTNVTLEACGALAQLTTPTHINAALYFLPNTLVIEVTIRIIGMLKHPIISSADSTLLLLASLCNLSLQSTDVTKLLYERNIIALLRDLSKDERRTSVLVVEQICNIFTRMATVGYIDALISQGALLVLLCILNTYNRPTTQSTNRVRYKCAVCLGTLGASSYGLKSIYALDGAPVLQIAIESERSNQSSVSLICSNLLRRIQEKYHQETMV